MEGVLAITRVGEQSMIILVKSILKRSFLLFGFYFFGSVLFLAVSGFWVLREANLATESLNFAGVRKSLSLFQVGYSFVSWTRFLPFIGEYTRDLSALLSASTAGLDAFEAAFAGNPAVFWQQLATVEAKMKGVDPNKYPAKYREKYQSIIGVLEAVRQLPYFAGLDKPRNLLIIFQNDKELRPTGGFMTAYSLVRVDKGRLSPVASEDMYNLDAKYKPVTPAPEPIVKYLKGPYVLSPNLRLRDLNWSPDFGASMVNLKAALEEMGVGGIDGVFAVDTQALVNILRVLGSVGVPGFGTYSTEIVEECKCPQVIRELESFADVEGPVVWDPVTGNIVYQPKNADNRKKIIGPLLNSMIAAFMSAPKEKYPFLFLALLKSLREKHILFYVFAPNVQNTLSSLDWDGKIKKYEGDYLHVNDANLGGRKSNLYVIQEVSQEIEIERGEIIKTLTLTYKNPMKHDGWLNSVLPNWVRVYVPQGSELLVAEGLEDKMPPYEDLGKTVFAGYFQLRPEGIAKVTFKYKLPFRAAQDYRLLIQKQPGTDAPLYTISIGKRTQEFQLKTDKEIKIRI